MKKKNLWLVIPAIALVLGLTIAGCSDSGDSGGGDKYNGQTIKSGSPSNGTLNKYSISSDIVGLMFTNARASVTSDADYKGYCEYEIKENGMKISILAFIWYNKTQAKYYAVADALDEELNFTTSLIDLAQYMVNDVPPGTMLASGGAYGMDYDDDYNYMNIIYPPTCTIQFFLKDYKDAPKNTMAVAFMTIKM